MAIRPADHGIIAAAGAAGETGAGYCCGGHNTSIDRYAFPADARTTLSATLDASTTNFSGMANSQVAGYTGAGYTTTFISTINKITFSDDSTSTLGAALSTGAGTGISAFANSGTAGYFLGGFVV